ncbi:MAG: hypothetical protein JW996_06085 [Candidatus Cloacimonetes bacterium]|nr:hypothetical protein [Candidatus Cloacimonadota bacterium]
MKKVRWSEVLAFQRRPLERGSGILSGSYALRWNSRLHALREESMCYVRRSGDRAFQQAALE